MPLPPNARVAFSDRGGVGWHRARPHWSRPPAQFPAVPLTARICASDGWLVAVIEGAGWRGTAATQGRGAAELRAMVADLALFATGRHPRSVRYVRDAAALG